MVQELWTNVMEHECLMPRTVEQWNHDSLYCYVCEPEMFDERRSYTIMADLIVANREEWNARRMELRQYSVLDGDNE